METSQLKTTSLEYLYEVDVVLYLDPGHRLPLWHPATDKQLEAGVRASLSAGAAYDVLTGGSDASHNVAFQRDDRSTGRRLRDAAEPAAAADDSSGAQTVILPADGSIHGRKIARRLQQQPEVEAAAWLEESLSKAEAAETVQEKLAQQWESLGMKAPASTKRSRGKAQKKRQAIQEAKEVEVQAEDARRRRLQHHEEEVAVEVELAKVEFTIQLTSTADFRVELEEPHYVAVLAQKLNEASETVRTACEKLSLAEVDVCMDDFLDLLNGARVEVTVSQITTSIQYEVLLSGGVAVDYDSNYTAPVPNVTDDGSSSWEPEPEPESGPSAVGSSAEVSLVQELWKLGVPILGSASVAALPEGMCTVGATIPNSNRAAVHERCRDGVLGATCSYTCADGYVANEESHVCGTGGAWRGGACLVVSATRCAASGQWWDLMHSPEDLTVLTGATTDSAIVTSSILEAQERWSSCHEDSNIMVYAVCATDTGGSVPCGTEMDVGDYTVQLSASKNLGGSELTAKSSFTLSVVDATPPVLDYDSCPESLVATWMTKLQTSVSAEDNCGEVRISACVVDYPTSPTRCMTPGLTERSARCEHTDAVHNKWPVTTCLASSVSGVLSEAIDVAQPGAGRWLVVTAEDLSGNVDKCHSFMSEW